MTKENFRFIRKLKDSVRIRRINSENEKAYSVFLRSDDDFLEDYGDTDLISFGVEDDDNPAGAIELAVSDGNIEIASVFVDEKMRRRGLGSALLVKAKEYTMECGFELAGAAVSTDDAGVVEFFRENGFFWNGTMEEDPIMVWIENIEMSEVLEQEENEVIETAGEVAPMAAILVPRLERLKGFIQNEGLDSEIVASENLYLLTDCNSYDVQISYFIEDESFSNIFVMFNAFFEFEGSLSDAKDICSEINSRSFFVSAFPIEGGINLKHTLAEGAIPIEETVFLAAFEEFCKETEMEITRAGLQS